MLGVIPVASLLCGFAPLEELAGVVNRSGHFFRPSGEQPHTRTGGFALGYPRVEPENLDKCAVLLIGKVKGHHVGWGLANPPLGRAPTRSGLDHK